jgi:glucose-1-phosphate adenylyltransferase
LAGSFVDHSVISPGVRVLEGATVSHSVLMSGTRVGPGAVIRNAILDKSIDVPPDTIIGVDHAHDRDRGFTVSDEGIVVLGKGQTVQP